MKKTPFKVLFVKRDFPFDIRSCSYVRYSVYVLFRNYSTSLPSSYYLTRVYSSYNFWKAKKYFDSHENAILVEE